MKQLPVDSGCMASFRDAVGDSGPVCVRGGGTRWDIGRAGGPPVREVAAPTGVEAFEPADMTVRVGAGTTLDELLTVLSAHGQEVALDGPPGSTLGGALMVGHSPLRRGRLGETTDALLQADCVGADGSLFTAGGPTVKNVTGYDLCRLLVGSLGTLALVGRVILRTRPLPETGRWLAGEVPPGVVRRLVHRPASLLWDGERSTVRIEGHIADVTDQADRLSSAGLVEVESPVLPPWRDSWPSAKPSVDGPSEGLPTGAVLEVGAGVLHRFEPGAPPEIPDGVAALATRVRDAFDPLRRLNPQCDPHRVPA